MSKSNGGSHAPGPGKQFGRKPCCLHRRLFIGSGVLDAAGDAFGIAVSNPIRPAPVVAMVIFFAFKQQVAGKKFVLAVFQVCTNDIVGAFGFGRFRKGCVGPDDLCPIATTAVGGGNLNAS